MQELCYSKTLYICRFDLNYEATAAKQYDFRIDVYRKQCGNDKSIQRGNFDDMERGFQHGEASAVEVSLEKCRRYVRFQQFIYPYC